MSFSFLDRYRDMVDDWDAFAEAAAAPLPWCVWTNPLRATPAQVADWLAQCGLEATPFTWLDSGFRVPGESLSLGTTLPFMAGLLHVQEEVSIIPAMLLDAQPGDRVLDTCAAPGGKTAYIATHMQNTGTVVANDRSVGRLRALRSIVDRLGLLNVSMIQQDASKIPLASGPFDRVLADVPCSCEGTSRKNPKLFELDGPLDYDSISAVQRRILRRALRLVRPGGRLVYSTCTYAPEENEEVIQHVLDDLGWADFTITPFALDGFQTTPGLDAWAGQTFHPLLKNAARVYPHHNDTGGFFIAILDRKPALDAGA